MANLRKCSLYLSPMTVKTQLPCTLTQTKLQMATERTAVVTAFPLLHNQTFYLVVLRLLKPGNKCCLIIFFDFFFPYVLQNAAKHQAPVLASLVVMLSRLVAVSAGSSKSRDDALATPTHTPPWLRLTTSPQDAHARQHAKALPLWLMAERLRLLPFLQPHPPPSI